MTNFKLNVQGSLINNILKVTIDGLVFKDDDGNPIPPDPQEPLTGVIGNNFTATSSGYDAENVPENVKDSDFNTRWSSSGIGETLTMALPDLYTVDSIQASFHFGSTRVNYFTLEYSLNGIDYIPIDQNFASSGTTDGFENFTFTPVNARYIKIIGGGNSANLWNRFTGVRLNYPEAVTEIPFPVIPPPIGITPTVYHHLNRPNFDDVTVGPVTNYVNSSRERYQALYHYNTVVRNDGDFSVIDISGKKYARYGFDKGKTHYDVGSNEWIKAANPTHLNPQEIWLSYDVTPRFLTPGEPPLWSIGGKLPGVVCGNFSGEPFATGGASLVGRGGSLRLNPNKHLDLGLYVYSHGSGASNQYGTDLGLGKFTTLNKEVQNRITIRTVMNYGGDANGIIQVWHDAELVITVSNLRWRLADTPANSFDFIPNGWFSGGSGAAFYHPTDSEFLNSYYHIGIGTGERVVYEREHVIILPWETIGGI